MNKLTAIGALAFACASFPARAERFERFEALADHLLQGLSDFTEFWYQLVVPPLIAICAVVVIIYLVHGQYFSGSSVAPKYLIRRYIRKYPELRPQILEHLQKTALTRADLELMEGKIQMRVWIAALTNENEEARRKQSDFLDKEL